MTTEDNTGDALWIDETLRGQIKSFNNIITKYQDTIYTLVAASIKHKEDAKDLTQNIFISAFSNLKKFRRECSLHTWLYRIAINQIKNYWRTSKNKWVITESEGNPAGNNDNWFKELSDDEHEIAEEELKFIAREMIACLPVEQRQLFVFYYVTGHTCQEIAEILKTSPSNVKIQLFRGRQYLYKKFKKIV